MESEIPRVNISVIGVSSYELWETGRKTSLSSSDLVGVGKSCLCSRFVTSSHDGYQAIDDDHRSLISGKAFRSREINSENFLFYGTSHKDLGDGQAVAVSLVEHTTFVEVETAMTRALPFPGCARYVERALMHTIKSPGKVSYVRRRLIGTEDDKREEFPHMLDVSGFVLVLDPTLKSEDENRVQIETLQELWRQIQRKRKPAALVVTKCDASAKKRRYVKHFARLPTFYSSAKCGVGVDAPFLFIAQQSLGRSLSVKPQSYSTTLDLHMAATKRLYQDTERLLANFVNDVNWSWESFLEMTKDEPSLRALIAVIGDTACEQLFRVRLLEVRRQQRRAAPRTLINLSKFVDMPSCDSSPMLTKSGDNESIDPEPVMPYLIRSTRRETADNGYISHKEIPGEDDYEVSNLYGDDEEDLHEEPGYSYVRVQFQKSQWAKLRGNQPRGNKLPSMDRLPTPPSGTHSSSTPIHIGTGNHERCSPTDGEDQSENIVVFGSLADCLYDQSLLSESTEDFKVPKEHSQEGHGYLQLISEESFDDSQLLSQHGVNYPVCSSSSQSEEVYSSTRNHIRHLRVVRGVSLADDLVMQSASSPPVMRSSPLQPLGHCNREHSGTPSQFSRTIAIREQKSHTFPVRNSKPYSLSPASQQPAKRDSPYNDVPPPIKPRPPETLPLSERPPVVPLRRHPCTSTTLSSITAQLQQSDLSVPPCSSQQNLPSAWGTSPHDAINFTTPTRSQELQSSAARHPHVLTRQPSVDYDLPLQEIVSSESVRPPRHLRNQAAVLSFTGRRSRSASGCPEISRRSLYRLSTREDTHLLDSSGETCKQDHHAVLPGSQLSNVAQASSQHAVQHMKSQALPNTSMAAFRTAKG